MAEFCLSWGTEIHTFGGAWEALELIDRPGRYWYQLIGKTLVVTEAFCYSYYPSAYALQVNGKTVATFPSPGGRIRIPLGESGVRIKSGDLLEMYWISQDSPDIRRVTITLAFSKGG